MLAAFPAVVYPQASVNVSTLDPVYRDIDKLVAQGLVDKIIVGQRPYSRKEIARITAEAMGHLSRLEEKLQDPKISEGKKKGLQSRLDAVQEILGRLKKDYGEELVQIGALEGEKKNYSLHLIEKAQVDVMASKSRPVQIPVSNGIGNINAQINPLMDYQEGRHWVDGFNLSLETTHWLRASPYFALALRPRFQLGIARDPQPNDNKAYIQNLYGKLNFYNFEIEAGRDNVLWGQGENAGLLLSNNPRGLDMVKISNDSPFILPWFLKYLGAHKLSFFYADLGPEQFYPHSYLVGYKWSIQPVSFFEIGLSALVLGGGKGSPSASVGDRISDIFPILGSSSSIPVSNKMSGVDMRFRIPPLRGTELYLEYIFDDKHQADAHTWFIQDAAQLAGIYVPRLLNDGTLDLRFEYHRTGVRFYRHGQFLDGNTLNGFILGDNLGPDAQGVYGTLNWDLNSHNLLTFKGAFEHRGSDTYKAISHDPVTRPLAVDAFVVVKSNPAEKRIRLDTAWLHRWKEWPFQLTVDLGYEHVINENFVSGQKANNVRGLVSFQVNFDRWAHFPRPK